MDFNFERPMSQTNETTRAILNFLFEKRIFAWRQNTGGIPDPRGFFRPAAKTGVADILAIVPPNGQFLAIEIKTGRDRLRPEQEGFLQNVRTMGGLALVVKDYDQFLDSFQKLW